MFPLKNTQQKKVGEKVGDWGGIVVMGFVEALKTGKGHYVAMFHDDGRFFAKTRKRLLPEDPYTFIYGC